MATVNVLYVGDDTLLRIPVIESVGFTVYQTEPSVPAICNAFADGDSFSAITFHTDNFAIPREPIWVTRTLSTAPLVLFENPFNYCEKGDFDLVIPNLTHPSYWLKNLRDVIETSRKLREYSRQLQKECRTLHSTVLEIRAQTVRLLGNPIDLDAVWAGEPDKTA